MNLAEIMQLCSLSMRTGRIDYQLLADQGQLFMEHGQVRHAVFQDKTGDDAVLEMLLKETGEAGFTEENVDSNPKTVQHSSNQLLLESARILDESREQDTFSTQDTKQLAAMKRIHRLVQISDDEPKIFIEITQDNLMLGRNEDNPLYLPHHTVSGKHCVFRIRGGKLFVSDIGSTNGTYVNNMPARESRLKHGDTLQIGGLLFRYEAVIAQNSEIPQTSHHAPMSREELHKTAAIPVPSNYRTQNLRPPSSH